MAQPSASAGFSFSRVASLSSMASIWPDVSAWPLSGAEALAAAVSVSGGTTCALSNRTLAAAATRPAMPASVSSRLASRGRAGRGALSAAGGLTTASTMRRSRSWRASAYCLSSSAPDWCRLRSCSSCWRNAATATPPGAATAAWLRCGQRCRASQASASNATDAAIRITRVMDQGCCAVVCVRVRNSRCGNRQPARWRARCRPALWAEQPNPSQGHLGSWHGYAPDNDSERLQGGNTPPCPLLATQFQAPEPALERALVGARRRVRAGCGACVAAGFRSGRRSSFRWPCTPAC